MKKLLYSISLIYIMSFVLQSINDILFIFHEVKYLSQPYDIRGFVKSIIYLGTYLCASGFLVFLLFIKSDKVFKILAILISLLYAVDIFIQFIGKPRGFSKDIFTLVVQEGGNYSFLQIYLKEIILALLLGSLLFLFLVFLRKKVMLRLNNKFIPLLLIPYIFTYLAVTSVSTIVYNAYPSFIKIPLIALNYTLHKPIVIKRVFPSEIKAVNNTKMENIIFIIDESVCGSYLSINGYSKNTTPQVSKLLENKNDIVNFGVVNSVSNCSNSSNIYLRLGMNPVKIHDYNNAKVNFPTIYQYAKNAGFTTYLFDAQAEKDALQNGLSIYDVQDIDHYFTFDRTVVPNKRDELVLDKVSKLLERETGEKHFIVIVKFGAHFPYLLSYNPDKDTIFRPALTSTYGGFNEQEKNKLTNTYLNSIHKNFDLYMDLLYNTLDLNNSIVFYTSDHGQDILETKNRITTHCNTTDIKRNEVTVPLLVLTKNAKNSFRVKPTKHYSQTEIFPTMLFFMGYPENIYADYGSILQKGLDKNITRKYFVVGTKKVGDYD